MINNFYRRTPSQESELSNGFVREIWLGLNKAIEINNTKAIIEIIEFLFERIERGIKLNNISLTSEYATILLNIYVEQVKNEEVEDLLTKKYVRNYKSLIEYNLKFIFDGAIHSVSERKKIAIIYDEIYYQYISFIHIAIENLEGSKIKDVLSGFIELIRKHDFDYSRDRIEIQQDIVKNGGSKKEAWEKIDFEFLLSYDVRIHQQSAYALLSWIYYLYSLNIIKEEKVILIQNLLDIHIRYFEEFIFDYLKLLVSSEKDFLGISDWDFTKRKDGAVYSPPSPRDWLTLGMSVILLRRGKPNIDFQLIKDHRENEYLLDSFKERFSTLSKNYDKWKTILGLDRLEKGEETLEKRVNELLTVFIGLKRAVVAQREYEIASELMDTALVNEFKSDLAEKFDINFTFLHLFKHFNNLEYSKVKDGIPLSSHAINLIGFKMMFTKKHHSSVYGSSDLGGEFARYLNRTYLSKIIAVKSNITAYDDAKEAVSKGFQNLVDRKVTPNLIIVPMDFSFRLDWVKNNPDFVPEWNRKETDTSINEIGSYKGVIISKLFNKSLNGKAIICDFNKAFKLTAFKDDSFYNEILSIQLHSLTKEEIDEKFSKEPTRYLVEENGLKITEDEAKIRMASQVLLKFELFCLLEINDAKAYEIISFKESSE